MFTFWTRLSMRELVIRQAPVFVLSLVIAELFYKFKSFSLECAAFIATWYVLDALVQFAISLVAPSKKASATDR